MAIDRIATRINGLDEVLDGGLHPSAITAIAGKAGTGKTMAMLATAAKSGADAVIYAPSLSYGDAKEKLAIIRDALGYNDLEVTYDLTNGLWLVVKLPDHTIRIAGMSARAITDAKTMLASMSTMAASGAAGLILADSPCSLVDGKKADDKMMASLERIARENHLPVIVTTTLPRTAGKPSIKDVKKPVRDHSDTVIWISSWPKITGGSAVFKVSALDDQDHDGDWEEKTAEIKFDGALPMKRSKLAYLAW